MIWDIIWMLLAFALLMLAVFLPETREMAQTYFLWFLVMDVIMIRRKMP